MDTKELALAIEQVCEEKGLTAEDVKNTIADALAAAFRKDFGDKKTQNIKVEFDLATGTFKVFDVKEVVEDELKEKYEKIREEIEKLKEAGQEITPEIMEEITAQAEGRKAKKKKPARNAAHSAAGGEKQKDTVEADSLVIETEEEKKFNPRTMFSLSEAKAIKKSYKLGDEVVTPLDVPAEFGRMAAQTAKQVIIQKIREAERNTVYEQYKDKISDLIVGTVQRQEGKIVLVDLGNTSAVVLPIDQIKNERYRPGLRLKFYVKSVEQTNRGPEILISRSHPEMLRKLFKLEVPEINSGAVIIKAIARDAGARSKIAVMAKEEGLDPIGACIGQRGVRVQTVINEIGGEKIDVIEWNEDLERFIINALAPAKIISVEIDTENKTARATVKEDQYSLAIGKGGQNVRLAAQLVGMRIDIVMEGGIKKTNADGEDNQVDKKEKSTAEEIKPKNEKTEEVNEDDKKESKKTKKKTKKTE